jgi:hypothetical protein
LEKHQKFLVAVLGAISIVGAFGIPIGDPKFIIQAIALESSFIVLAFLSAKKYQYAYIPNFVIAIIVIIGNTISPKHTEIMYTLHPLYNGIVLIIGGYILQGLLITANILALKSHKEATRNSITTA